jgi:2-keto-4-pentenoate hydratase/2-oxohepta-3-ene-1,7-dioic acid hydratase in catechol pathway
MSNVKKFASFYANGRKRFGVVTDKGLIDISERYSKKWLSLQEMILEGNLQNIYEEIDINKTDYNFNDVRFEIPIQSPEKIICVGVNYPARNEEYKDGQKAPEYPSLFVRFPGKKNLRGTEINLAHIPIRGILRNSNITFPTQKLATKPQKS